MKEVARTGGGRALEVDALRVPGATAGKILRHDGTEFIPSDETTEVPAGAHSQTLVHNGIEWTARARVFYGTAAARDASTAIDGDVWAVDSGAGSGTTWIFATTWQQVPLGLVSPLTTRGDLWVRDASGAARLAVGGASEILGSDGTDPVYRALDEFMPSAQVSTNDDSWMTVVTITTDAELAIVETHFSVVARKDDWSEGGAWRGTCAHRRYGGTYNAMGSVAWQPNFSENVLLDVRVTEDASGVYIQVKGPPATDYRWQVKYLRNVLES